VPAALKTAIKDAQADTTHGMPLLSEILTAFEEEQQALTGFAQNFWERALRETGTKRNPTMPCCWHSGQTTMARFLCSLLRPLPLCIMQHPSLPKTFEGQVCRLWGGHACHHEHEVGIACKMAGTLLREMFQFYNETLLFMLLQSLLHLLCLCLCIFPLCFCSCFGLFAFAFA
jgi:hypothetical protein